jgi:hypothetical protein
MALSVILDTLDDLSKENEHLTELTEQINKLKNKLKTPGLKLSPQVLSKAYDEARLLPDKKEESAKKFVESVSSYTPDVQQILGNKLPDYLKGNINSYLQDYSNPKSSQFSDSTIPSQALVPYAPQAVVPYAPQGEQSLVPYTQQSLVPSNQQELTRFTAPDTSQLTAYQQLLEKTKGLQSVAAAPAAAPAAAAAAAPAAPAPAAPAPAAPAPAAPAVVATTAAAASAAACVFCLSIEEHTAATAVHARAHRHERQRSIGEHGRCRKHG